MIVCLREQLSYKMYSRNQKRKSKRDELRKLIEIKKSKSFFKDDFIPFVSPKDDENPLLGLKYISDVKCRSDDESSTTQNNLTNGNASDASISTSCQFTPSEKSNRLSVRSTAKRIKLSNDISSASNSCVSAVIEESNRPVISQIGAKCSKDTVSIREENFMNRLSICTSEESIDLNDLKGYHDFEKNNNSSSSSMSSYCEIINDDNIRFDPTYGYVEMNVNLNGQETATESKLFDKSNLSLKPKTIKMSDKCIENANDLNIKNENNDEINAIESDSDQSITNDSDEPIIYQQPWIDKRKSYLGIVGLHKEIEDFYNHSKLRTEEIKVRNFVFLKVKKLITNKWRDAKVYVFGSYQTDLSLPNADLDIVIFNFVKKIPFYQLEADLVSTGMTTYQDTKIISKAAVPIIKFKHKDSGLEVDLSFNCEDGPRAIELIKSQLKKYPAMAKLLLIMKLYLHQRNLNFAYTGGLSSYSLTLMMLAFFQKHHRLESLRGVQNNLGVLLMEFVEFYGILFNHKVLAIRVTYGGQFLKKTKLPALNAFEVNKNQLCIEDPMDSTNNPAKNSYLYDLIKKSFRNAYHQLHVRICSKNSDCLKSILGELIGYTNYEIEQRQRIIKFYESEFLAYKPNKNSFDPQSDFIPFSQFDDDDYIPEKIISYEEYD